MQHSCSYEFNSYVLGQSMAASLWLYVGCSSSDELVLRVLLMDVKLFGVGCQLWCSWCGLGGDWRWYLSGGWAGQFWEPRFDCFIIIYSMSRIGESGRQYDRMVKVLMIGNSGVGKSAILLQYSDKKFVHNYYNTIGVDYKIKFLNFRGLTVKLQWDTAGQDRFKTITSSYYRGADGIIIAYDITDRTSFDNVKVWLQEIEKYVGEKTKKYIIGNKTDLQERRQVSTQEGIALTKKLGIPFRQTSARLATNIDSLFQDLLEKILFDEGESSSFSKQPQTAAENSPVGGKRQTEALNIKEMMQNKKKEEQGCCQIY